MGRLGRMLANLWDRWQPGEEHLRAEQDVVEMRKRADAAIKARQRRLQVQYEVRGREQQR